MTRIATEPRPGEVHLGDLLRALGTLHWEGPAAADAIAACLGFGLRAPAPPAPPPVEVYDQRAREPRGTPAPAPPAEPPVYCPPAPRRPPALPDGVLPILLTGPTDLPAADWDLDWTAADPGPLSEVAAPTCARATLFPERGARHLIAATVATARTGTLIDLRRLIDALARRAVLDRLPRLTEPTLTSGCQLLLDYSQSMVPFWEDLNDLARQAESVVGTAATRVYRCDGDPATAASRSRGNRPEPWQPDGRPVLVATDLGIRGTAAPACPHPGWEALVRRCARAGSPLAVLIPWPKARWPDPWPGPTAMIHWSPQTGVGRLRRALEPGRRRP